MTSRAFDFLVDGSERTRRKPRARGMTSLEEFGTPLNVLEGELAIGGHALDYAKFTAATAHASDKAVLRDKIALYRDHMVKPYLGGQIYEYALHTLGLAAVERLWSEAAELGFQACEVSGTFISLAPDQRSEHLALARSLGLEGFAETGTPGDKQTVENLVADVTSCFADGAAHVNVEGAEMIEGDAPRLDLIRALRDRCPIDRIFFELPWIGYPGISHSVIIRLKHLLILEVGVNVNIANVQQGDLVELEAMRSGIDIPALWAAQQEDG